MAEFSDKSVIQRSHVQWVLYPRVREMLCRFVLFACDKVLTDLIACLISICKARSWGRPDCLSRPDQVKVVLVAVHEVDEMMQIVITVIKVDKPPYSA